MNHPSPHAIIVCVGDELLDGRVFDRNISTIARALAARGVEILSCTFVRDDLDAIQQALLTANQHSPAPSLVVITGGLGPTQDDLTRQAASQFFDAELHLDDHALSLIRDRFAARSRPLTDNNLIQAHFPEGACILYSEVGTASGFLLERHGARHVFLPGVPSEVHWFMEERLDEMLPTAFAHPPHLRHETKLYLFGTGESALEHALLPLPNTLLEGGIKLSWLASDPIIELRATASSSDLLERFVQHARDRLGHHILSRNLEPFAYLGQALLEQHAEVSSAESCTGGMFSAAITEIPGSSGWFARAFVTYSNESKQELVGVLPETLEAHGAVSAQTVLQMASGARQRANASYAIAISGVAGPSGGSPEKPVGTVFFGLSAPDGTGYVHHALFQGLDRARIRQRSIYTALRMLLWRLHEDRAFKEDTRHQSSSRKLETLGLQGPYDEAQIWSSSMS